MDEIYDYIDNVKIITENDFLHFVKTLTNYFAQQFGVKNCECQLKKQDLNKSAFVWVLRTAECIPVLDNGIFKSAILKFDPSVAKQGNLARIIKLTAHEWMHYYDMLVKSKTVKAEDVDVRYKDLLTQSKHFVSAQMKKEIIDLKIYDCLLKLSPLEMVADLHAKNVLQDVLQHTNNRELKADIQVQLNNYNNQIVKHQKYLKEQNFEGYDYNNIERWRKSKTNLKN